MNFLPDDSPVIKVLECQATQIRAPHATWDYVVHLSCQHPAHFIFIKVCDCCGMMTEQTYTEGNGVEVVYTYDEVMAFMALDGTES